MSEDKTTKEKLAEVIDRFYAHHIPNISIGVTGPDIVRHVTRDVDALHELVDAMPDPIPIAALVESRPSFHGNTAAVVASGKPGTEK